jgi:ribosomal protein L30
MPFFRITLLRSGIGLPVKTRSVLTALGLRKRMATVYQPVSQDVAGMIMKVKELVDVEEVEERKTKAEVKLARKPDPGFYVEKRASKTFV